MLVVKGGTSLISNKEVLELLMRGAKVADGDSVQLLSNVGSIFDLTGRDKKSAT